MSGAAVTPAHGEARPLLARGRLVTVDGHPICAVCGAAVLPAPDGRWEHLGTGRGFPRRSRWFAPVTWPDGRDRRLGHQIRSPRSRLSAVTSTDRTMIVSISTPIATQKPISVKITRGRVASVANVPASTRPAEVITPPVAASPVSAPWRVPERLASSRTLVIRKML